MSEEKKESEVESKPSEDTPSEQPSTDTKSSDTVSSASSEAEIAARAAEAAEAAVKKAIAKAELANEWNVDPSDITDGDANWRSVSKEKSQALASKNWPEYLGLLESSIRQLYSESNSEQALKLIPECIYLTYAAPNELDLSGLADYSLLGNEKKTYAPLASLYESVGGDLNTIRTSYKEFAAISAFSKIFELSPKDAWIMFEKDFKEYLAEMKTS